MPSKPGQELVGHSGNDHIGTPDDLWAWLDWRFAFDYDAFASHTNHLCSVYSTEDGTFEAINPRGNMGLNDSVWLDSLDGFTHPWQGQRVFWNPPYSMLAEASVKAIAERNNACISVGLIKWDTSTRWSRAIAEHAHIEVLPRIKYKGMLHAATFASAIVIMKPDLWSPKGRINADRS